MSFLTSQERDAIEVCSKIELIGQVLEFVEESCYFGDTTGGRRGAIDGVLTKARNS